MPRIGIVSGLLEEAESFRPGVGKARRKSPYYCREDDGGWVVGCAGIGKVNAAMVATEMVDAGCKILISMGVAGRIGKATDRVYWVDRAYQHDYGRYGAEGMTAYRAGSLPFGKTSRDPFVAIDDPGLDLPRATILTGDCFLEDPDHGGKLAEQFDAELIDMETAAIAQVAAMHRVGWASVRAVSDDANAAGEDDFRANLVRAAARAGDEVDRLVDLLLT